MRWWIDTAGRLKNPTSHRWLINCGIDPSSMWRLSRAGIGNRACCGEAGRGCAGLEADSVVFHENRSTTLMIGRDGLRKCCSPASL